MEERVEYFKGGGIADYARLVGGKLQDERKRK